MKFKFLFLFFLTVNYLFAADIPESFYGIWEAKDRYVFFEHFSQEENPQLVICLKEYYGWYVDRTAEPQEFEKKYKRDRNAGSTKEAVQVYINNHQNFMKNACEIEASFSKAQKNYVPVYNYQDKLYLNFLVRDENNPQFYRGNSVSKGFLVSEQSVQENISGYVIDFENNYLFDIRYWRTDMDFSNDNVNFTWNNNEYSVPKHILSGNNVYSCVTGRSKKIRNLMPPVIIDTETLFFNEDRSILILDSEPFLIKLTDKNTFDDLIEILKIANSKRKPDPAPLFPPDDLNWHWDIIDQLEKDNYFIQQVRKRQIDFGPRGH